MPKFGYDLKNIEKAMAAIRMSPKSQSNLSRLRNELNKFFTIANMPIASSQYWNSIHGREPGEAEADGEGRQTMRTLARNMTFLMRSIALGKERFGLPEKETRIATHFIR